jgi:hypothetical protein
MTFRRGVGAVLACLLSVGFLFTGCSKPAGPTFTQTNLPTNTALRDRIDVVVDSALNNRTLNDKTHNAWQVIHGILPYGREFKIDHDGQLIPALDWLLTGGELKGWDLYPGPHGVIAKLEPGSKAAEGHPDQWIGYFSEGGLDGIHGLSKDEPITVKGKQYKLDDILTEAEWDVTPGMEASWTIMAMAAWRPIDYKWTSSDGEEWTVERLVGMDAGAGVGEGASCGGTHRLSGLTLAVQRYMKETGTPADKLTGGWKKANDVIQDSIHKAKMFQQPDGCFSANFFVRPGSTTVVNDRLHSTGHTLEWLTVALDDNEIRQPWVTAAVARMCQMLEDNADRELDCGALYHGARGLKLYRERVFGPRDNQSAAVIARAPNDAAAAVKNSQAVKAAGSTDDAPPALPEKLQQ